MNEMYLGWTNRETWQVGNWILSNPEPLGRVLPLVKEYKDLDALAEAVKTGCTSPSYQRSHLWRSVDWRDIAEALQITYG